MGFSPAILGRAKQSLCESGDSNSGGGEGWEQNLRIPRLSSIPLSYSLQPAQLQTPPKDACYLGAQGRKPRLKLRLNCDAVIDCPNCWFVPQIQSRSGCRVPLVGND